MWHLTLNGTNQVTHAERSQPRRHPPSLVRPYFTPKRNFASVRCFGPEPVIRTKLLEEVYLRGETIQACPGLRQPANDPLAEAAERCDPSWLKLVHTSAALVDGVECLAEVVGEGAAAVMRCCPA